MNFDTLEFSIDTHVAIIRLNRPAAANGINMQMAHELMLLGIECQENPDIRAVLLTGNGKMFSAGGDLKSFAAYGEQTTAKLHQLMSYMHAAITRFANGQAPFLVAVNGVAAGAGFSFACAADIAFAANTAKFTMAYTAAGLSPDGGASFYLPRLVGMRRAQELMLTNRLLSADEAKDWGIINDVIEADDLFEHALTQAKALAQGPTQAYASVKQLLVNSYQSSLEAQLELEANGMAAMSRTSDGKEGIEAFCQKRKPQFSGK